MESGRSFEERVLELQMLLTNSSFSHEYARMEMEQTRSNFKKSLLAEKLEYFRKVYFEARSELASFSPEVLESVEQDLSQQKNVFFAPVAAELLN